MSVKHLLQESHKFMKRHAGVNPVTDYRQVLSNETYYKNYLKSLSEGLQGDTRDEFLTIGMNSRRQLMENSFTQINAYESLTLPVLRVFYPKLIAKELVNVMPIDKPDVVQGFIRAYFGRNSDTGHPYSFPSVSTDISRGPGVTVSSPGEAALSGASHNIFAQIGTGLSSDNAHISKDFYINYVYDGTAWISCEIIPDVDGNFSSQVTLSGAVTDVLSGNVDYENGTLVLSSLSGTITSVRYVAYCSLEENQVNPTTRFAIEKIMFKTVDRRISAEWTLDLEQDAKALFDIQVQSEFVNLIGEQIALDIDNEIISKLIAVNSASNPATHTKTFDKNPPPTFYWGRKQWYENLIPTLNELSAQIYNSCLMGAANTLACNPLDAAIFESFNSFEYEGNSVDGGEVGYRSAKVAGGKWKILISSIVPQGTIIAKYRSNDLQRAAFVYAPYVPALLMPYPLGEIPSLTIMTRYATKSIRPEAIGVITVSDTA